MYSGRLRMAGSGLLALILALAMLPVVWTPSVTPVDVPVAPTDPPRTASPIVAVAAAPTPTVKGTVARQPRASRSVKPRTAIRPPRGRDLSAATWRRLAECESGGRLHAVSPSGTFLGLYQLHRGFYITHGHRGDEWKQLSAAEQLNIARYVLRRQGPGAWACAGEAGML